MSVDWEEVKRLAADFQRTQLSDTLQRLSERNCVEIIRKLQDMQLIEVIFTCDGREYLTPEHLLREISDELYSSGGRVSMTDLASILNVDYAHIEAKSGQLSRTSGGDIGLVLGQLVSRQYKDLLAEEIDLRLQESGTVTIGELTKQYDLTTEFLENLITERLGIVIRAKCDANDQRTLITEEYLSQYQSRITGVLSAATKPVSLVSIMNRYKFPERIFNSIISSLTSSGRLSGVVSGRMYIPDIYSKTQFEYVQNFYQQNGYLDYSTLTRLGIANAQSYLQKRFADELCYLDSCAVGPMLMFQVESSIEECHSNNNWIDMVSLLPTVLSPLDVNLLINKTLEQYKNLQQSSLVLCETIVVSQSFISKCQEYFEPLMMSKAEADFKSGLLLSVFAAQQSAKMEAAIHDERKVETSASMKASKKGKKSGGGAQSQGREVKTKAVKKKYKPGQKPAADDDSDDASSAHEIKFMTIDEIIAILGKNIPHVDECNDDFLHAIATFISEPLRIKYTEIARNYFTRSMTTSGTAKKSFADVQRTVNQMYSNICMFEKGIKILVNDDLQSQLTKYLLRSLCTDVANAIILHLTAEESATIATPEARLKLINKFSAEFKECFTKLHSSLNGKSLDEFHEALDNCCGKCELMLKKVDKKRERIVVSDYRQSLILQMNECADPAMILHLTVILQIQSIHNEMIHASGKFVPQLLSFLRPNLESNAFASLHECQDLVIRHLTVKDEDEKQTVRDRLNQLIPKVKEIGLSIPSKQSKAES